MLLTLVALAALASAGQPAQEAPRFTIVVTGAPGAETQRGIELGVAEASQTVGLLGGNLRLVRGRPPAGANLAGVIVVGAAAQRSGDELPRIHLGPLPQGAGPCSFSVAAAPVKEDGVVVWHPSLSRFGASQLNERFVKRHGAGMTGDGYAGWIAVKALVESALRARNAADRCAAVARLRFDGHKGRPLTFDPETRVLRQPLYLLRDGRIVGERQ